jgi:hypothetical protein
MKRLVVLLLMVLFLVFALPVVGFSGPPVSEQWAKIVNAYYQNMFREDGPVSQTWKDGIKQDYGFDLRQLEVTINLSPSKENKDYVVIGASIKIVAFCLDQNGIKKSIKLNAKTALLIDKNGKQILQEIMLDRGELELFNGWNGVDV